MTDQRRKADEIPPKEFVDLTGKNTIIICSICIKPTLEPVSTMCGHLFCLQCLVHSWLSSDLCPECGKITENCIRLHP